MLTHVDTDIQGCVHLLIVHFKEHPFLLLPISFFLQFPDRHYFYGALKIAYD